MEEEMMMIMVEEEEEEESEYTINSNSGLMIRGEEEAEIDLDYEFDAARFFDFTRPESSLEEHHAQLWFQSAPTYPPSPFVARLLVAGTQLINHNDNNNNVNISPKSIALQSINFHSDAQPMDLNQTDKGQQVNWTTSSNLQTASRPNVQKLPPSGLTFYNHMVTDMTSKCQTKKSIKPLFPRTSSTLMKPTASQLAKQNRPLQALHSRPNMFALDKTDKSSASTSGIENQAAKRQKLEGGLLRKVVGTFQLQPTNFVHKAPKRDVFCEGNSTHSKSRITIPREPDLETAHRAQRTRPKSSKEAENVTTSTVRRFKALPLNRKILEAPPLLPKRSTPRLPDFQEFHLKTSERAMQHGSVPRKSMIPFDSSEKAFTNLTTDCGNREPARPSLMNSSKIDARESSHCFKALPLNKKILTSKGDIGVFRNNKKESTVPMEFNFQTDKRSHHNPPPIDLFNKLSLAPEAQRLPTSGSKFSQSNEISAKGSKENRWGVSQQENAITLPAKSKLSLLGGKHQYKADEGKHEVSSLNNWNTGVR